MIIERNPFAAFHTMASSAVAVQIFVSHARQLLNTGRSNSDTTPLYDLLAVKSEVLFPSRCYQVTSESYLLCQLK